MEQKTCFKRYARSALGSDGSGHLQAAVATFRWMGLFTQPPLLFARTCHHAPPPAKKDLTPLHEPKPLVALSGLSALVADEMKIENPKSNPDGYRDGNRQPVPHRRSGSEIRKGLSL